MGFHFVSLFALVLAVMLHNVNAWSESVEEKMKKRNIPLMMECAKEMDLTMEKVKEMVESGATMDTSCFIACCFKKAGLIDDEGMFSVEAAQKMAKEMMEGESDEEAKLMDDVIQKCTSVNDEPVEEDGKVCQRAALLKKCFHQH